MKFETRRQRNLYRPHLITKPKPEIEENIPDWKASVTGSLGTGSIAGTAIMSSEISDDTLMALVKKHFNAVTFGNELKPDALFNYQIGQSVDSTTITFQGKELKVPVVNDKQENLDFSRADAMLDKILEWNNANPNDKIRVRGHVLVWHYASIPEFGFLPRGLMMLQSHTQQMWHIRIV